MNTKPLRLFGAALLLFSSSGLAMASTIGFNPDPIHVTPGEIFSVDIVGTDFTELSGGTFDLGFDSAHVQINSVSIDPYWDFLPKGGGPAAGDVWPQIWFDVFDNDAVVGDHTIATINLTALVAGTSNLVILNAKIFSTTERLDPTLINGTVGAVPVPAAAWLFGSGLIGLVGMARRKQAT